MFKKLNKIIIFIPIIVVIIITSSFHFFGLIERDGYSIIDSPPMSVDIASGISDNERYGMYVRYHSKIFRHSDIYGVYLNTNKLPEHITLLPPYEEGTPYLTIESTKPLEFDEKLDLKYTLKIKTPIWIGIVATLLFLSILTFLYIKIPKYFFLSLKVICAGIIIFIPMLLVYIISRYILSSSGIDTFRFILGDPLFSSLFVSLAYYLSNKNKIITVISASLIVFFIFIVQPVGITTQNTPLFFSDIPTLYPALIATLSFPMKALVNAITIVYFSLIALCLIYFIKSTIKTKWYKSVTILFLAAVFVFVLFFKPIEFEMWNINIKKHANRNGIISAMNYRINYEIRNQVSIKEKDVANALTILKELESKRDTTNILLREIDGSIENKRDVFIIFLESFYDYSHFISLFDEDPFPKEYRDWAKESAKVGPNTGGGSFYARLTGLTASTPLYPNTLSADLKYMLPHLLRENGYYTLALEEAAITYNLNTFLPRIGFKKVVFGIGSANISEYLRDNLGNLDKPLFVYGFTFLGHTGTYKEDYKLDANNIKNFINLLDEKDRNILIKTLSTSVATAKEIIKTRNIILEHSSDALIIFKHDHLYPYLDKAIKNSDINDGIKNSFLTTYTPSPILVWDGANGAYKLPHAFSPENIPLFIALNLGVPYKGTPISLLYKDNINNTIRFYGSIYETNSSGEIELTKDYSNKNIEEVIKYENAHKVLSEDIFKGRKFFYKLNTNKN